MMMDIKLELGRWADEADKSKDGSILIMDGRK